MDKINAVCWAVATILLVSSGIYFTIVLRFPQFSFKKMINSLKPEKSATKGISPFETLTLSLAARIGVGSLAGIALGIFKGGVGTIFWLWLSALLTLPNTLSESTLAVRYRERDGKFYKGGPAYYINKGLGYKKLSILYAIIVSFCYLGGFLAIQSNTIASSLKDYLNIPTLVSGIIVAFISYIIIIRGIKGIAKFTSFLVPIMGILYMLVAILIIILNIEKIPNVFMTIIKEAFNFKSFGWGIVSSMIIGVQRGIFSSESGIGTGAVASGTSDTKYPIKQGYLQMLGVYFTTFVVCTATALIILTADIDINSFIEPNGIEITNRALNYHLGNSGNIVLLLAILAFSFSTVISGYYYGESNIKYLYNKITDKQIFVLKIIVVGLLLYGAIAKSSFLWNIVDIGVALLAIINIFALISLRRDVKEEHDEVELREKYKMK